MTSTQSNAAAIRAFRIVELLAQAREPLTLMEISTRMDLPKQSVHRLLKQLESAWLVNRDGPGKHYVCSSRVRQMAINLLMTTGPAAARRAILQEMADKVQASCNLAISGGDAVVYLDRVESNWSASAKLTPGTRVPFHCTASGKLLMSFLPRQQRELLLRKLPLRRWTERSICDMDTLRADLEETRRRRLGLNTGEYIPGVVAVAVPVMLHAKKVGAAVAIQASAEQFTIDDLMQWVPQLREVADRLAATFDVPDERIMLAAPQDGCAEG
ncbi:IclR family transcriptional regulator [Diaphorobacter ruginosibacter]|uniref:IclR family transcriptional regulator n=1 Tax=Diaphorobacter ruginosibacter TaxID=1715720 RepID=A0A7G9RRQ7_9BURK|nr:IclR family transcriptional regulator [Diaphorobacter ruginosibacter]QNN58282.1 IclR family transcriptional regulator [Diaphorobacter ruginosibacter]